jgi:nucleoside-diphosphate-sugar epimerase
MKVMVTGGCGYIGLHLCKQLAEAGHEVVVLDKCLFPSGVTALAKVAPEAILIRKDIRAVTADDFAGVDAVCHLGGLSNDPTADYNPDANWAINCDATVTLAATAKDAGVWRFTFASTASVYGDSHAAALTEESPVSPHSNYSQAKLAAEERLLDWTADGDFEPIILRQATVSGWSWRMRWDLVVNTMVKSALRYGTICVHAGGEAFRPIIDVQDVAEAHVRFLDAKDVGGQVFNVAHRRQPHGAASPLSEGYTIACLALYVKELLYEAGHEATVYGDWSRSEGRSYDMSCHKMRNALQWEPQRGVRAMVRSLLDEFSVDDLRRTDDPECYNIAWMTALDQGAKIAAQDGG